MNRFDSFRGICGKNWCTGRFLLPELARLGREPGEIVLDMACGESPFRLFFSNSARYLRIDRFHHDKDVVIADMAAIPCRHRFVDVILLCQAISDTPNPVAVLAEAHRVLKPGGRLILFESMDYPEHDLPHDYYRLLPAGLRLVAAKTGLTMSELIYLGGLGTRCATLWNTLFMGKILATPFIGFLGRLGIVAGNILCYGLDVLMPHPRLAANYLAVLTRPLDE